MRRDHSAVDAQWWEFEVSGGVPNDTPPPGYFTRITRRSVVAVPPMGPTSETGLKTPTTLSPISIRPWIKSANDYLNYCLKLPEGVKVSTLRMNEKPNQSCMLTLV